MKPTLHTLFLLFLTTLALAQNENRQRAAFKLKLKVDENRVYTADVPRSNYFPKHKLLALYPSEKVLVEVTLINDTIQTMKVVKHTFYPERTITVEFRQAEEGEKIIGMVLNVTNPFDKKLYYDGYMMLPNSNKWIPTSVMPVNPYVVGVQSWGKTIVTICLDNWRFVSASNKGPFKGVKL